MDESASSSGTREHASRVSGRYRGVSRQPGYAVDMRVDVDGPGCSRRLSADIFDVRSEKPAYRGSLVVVEPRRTDHALGVTLDGRGSFSSSTTTPYISVTIHRPGPDETPRATLSRSGSGGRPGPVYDCELVSPYFRKIELVEDREHDVDALDVYDSPDGRELSIASVFEAAGIELHTTSRGVVGSTAAGPDLTWSDAELHAAMTNRLGGSATPEWVVWLLHAHMHERDRDSDGTRILLGSMFDAGARHGCATFYRWLGGTSDEHRREQLFAAVHEIGHTLNLGHCWHQSIVGPARPDSMTWMNNPRGWPRGADAFWRAFAFGFDAPELAHVRHGFWGHVIMGAGTYGRPRPHGDRTPLAVDGDRTGLHLRLGTPRELADGLPMTVELQLSATSIEPVQLPPVLGPRAGSVDVLIRCPDGTERAFEPLVRHCRADTPVLLRAGDPPVRDWAFVHYGKDGFAFEKPGRYELRARCVTADGSVVLSAPAVTEVRPPLSRADVAAQRWLWGDEQGILMSLLGSSGSVLTKGNEQLQELIARHPDHPAAAVARLVRGTNAAREFKTIEPNGRVSIVPRDPAAARALLSDVIDVDALRRAACDAADERAASKAMNEALARIGTRRHVPATVDRFISSRRTELTAHFVEGLA